MSNIPGYPATKRRRSKAWIYYAIISILGIIAAPGSHGLSLIMAVLAGLYAWYLFRGGRIAIWFW